MDQSNSNSLQKPTLIVKSFFATSFSIFILGTIGIILAGLLAYATNNTGIQEKSIDMIKKLAIVSILFGFVGGIATASNKDLATPARTVSIVK
jgi:hypothetical protein